MIKGLHKIFGSRTKALEVLYLLQGVKPVVRQGFYEDELPKIHSFAKKSGLSFEKSLFKVVLADPYKKYSNKGVKVRPSDPRRGMFFVYLSRDPNKSVMAAMFEFKNDHRGLGKILGYPDCCVDFFLKHEPSRSVKDMDFVSCSLRASKGLRYPFFNNITKRHLDFTLLNHFPCSFNCDESIKIAKKHLSVIGKFDRNLAMRFSSELKSKALIGKRFAEFH